MKKDEFNQLFDSMEIREDVYDRLVTDTLRRHQKKRRKQGQKKTYKMGNGWGRYVIAGIPVFAVLCLVAGLKMAYRGQEGAAVLPASLEETMSAETSTPPETSSLETTTLAVTIPAVTEPVPGARAVKLFAMSGIQPVMNEVSQGLLNIAVETYFEQLEELEMLCREEFLADDDDMWAIAAEDVSSAQAALTSMRSKPEKVYYLEYGDSQWSLQGKTDFFKEQFGESFSPELVLTALRGDSSLPFTSLIDAAMQTDVDNEYRTLEEILYSTVQKTFSMQCTEGLEQGGIIGIKCPYGQDGWFFYEFAPSEQGTMLVSAGFCPEWVSVCLFDNFLSALGYTIMEYDYYDFRWGTTEE